MWSQFSTESLVPRTSYTEVQLFQCVPIRHRKIPAAQFWPHWYGSKSFGGQKKVRKLLLIIFLLNFPSIYSSLDQQGAWIMHGVMCLLAQSQSCAWCWMLRALQGSADSESQRKESWFHHIKLRGEIASRGTYFCIQTDLFAHFPRRWDCRPELSQSGILSELFSHSFLMSHPWMIPNAKHDTWHGPFPIFSS